MPSFQTPLYFDYDISTSGGQFLYHDIRPISPNGPLIGYLEFNGIPVSNYRFGGPMLMLSASPKSGR